MNFRVKCVGPILRATGSNHVDNKILNRKLKNERIHSAISQSIKYNITSNLIQLISTNFNSA